MTRNVVIFLEPKGAILEVIRTAKEQGHFILAVVSDPSLLESAPAPYRSALGCIDQTMGIDSWNHPDLDRSILEKAKSIGTVVGVYSGVDPCAIVCASIRQKLGLTTPTPETLQVILNKYLLRCRLREIGLSKLKSYHQSSVEKWTRWEIGTAAYFKPVRGFFSAYVHRCKNLDELIAARTDWLNGCQAESPFIKNYLQSEHEYHVEEAFDGELLSVEAISFKGEFHCLGLLSRILYSKNPIVEMGSCFPYPHPLTEKIVSLVKNAHLALGFTDGPSHTEVIVNGEGEIEIIDFNPRFVGADVLQSINHAYGIRIEESLLDWACGNKPVIRPHQSLFSCIQYVLSPAPIEFRSISLPKDPQVMFHATFVKPGSRLSSIDRQLDYLACYLTVMPGFDLAIRKSNELREQIRINGSLAGAY